MNRTAVTIPADDLEVGQRLRPNNDHGQGVAVVRIQKYRGQVIVDLADVRLLGEGYGALDATSAVVEFTEGAGHVLTTYVPEGVDPATDRFYVRSHTDDWYFLTGGTERRNGYRR